MYFYKKCDTEVLSELFLTSLITNLPCPESLNLLKDNTEHDNLTEADQFCLGIADFDRLHARLECLLFKHQYAQHLQESKEAIENAKQACKAACIGLRDTEI